MDRIIAIDKKKKQTNINQDEETYTTINRQTDTHKSIYRWNIQIGHNTDGKEKQFRQKHEEINI